MVDLSAALLQMVMLFIVACLGFLCAKLGYLDDHTRTKVTRILMDVTLPCSIVASSSSLDQSLTLMQILMVFGLTFVEFFLMVVSGYFCNLVLRTPKDQRIVYVFMSLCSATSFIGIPVVAALYGGMTMILSSIFITVHSFLIYTIGFALLGGADKGNRSLKGLLKTVLTPVLFACIIAIALFMLKLQLPEFLVSTLSTVGGMTTPMAMMVVGALISTCKFREIVGEVRLYPYIIIRKLVLPFVLFMVLRFFVSDASMLGMFTIMFAMPVGAMAPVFIDQYGHDGVLAAKGIVLSTALSFVLIPVLVTAMVML